MTPPSHVGSDCKTTKNANTKTSSALLDLGNTLDSHRDFNHKFLTAASLQNSDGLPFKYQSKLDFNFDKEDNIKMSLRKEMTASG
jgi:hypothetical protein